MKLEPLVVGRIQYWCQRASAATVQPAYPSSALARSPNFIPSIFFWCQCKTKSPVSNIASIFLEVILDLGYAVVVKMQKIKMI